MPRKAKPDFHRQVQQLCKEADRYSTFALRRPVVYCIQSGEAPWFKIGKAVSKLSRMNTLQTGNPEPLQLRGLIVHRSIEGAAAHETSTHYTLGAYRGMGDWFRMKMPFFEGVASCEEKWGRCAFCDMTDKGITMTERRKPVPLQRRIRRVMRHISEASWADQLVLGEIRLNRRKASRQHQWVRKKRVVTHRSNLASWGDDTEVARAIHKGGDTRLHR